MKKNTSLLIALACTIIFNLNTHAQSIQGIIQNQPNHLTGDYSFSNHTKGKEGLIPVDYNLAGNIHFENKNLIKEADDEGLVLDSIVVESVDENNNWIKDGVYKYGIEEEGNKIIYKIYFLDKVSQDWEGFAWKEYEYDEQGRLIRSVFNENMAIYVKEKKLNYFSIVEMLYEYTNEKTVERISYKRNPAGDEFVPDSKKVQIFDENENLLKEELFSWNSEDETWFLFRRYEYAYDENGYQTHFSDTSWDYFSGVEMGWEKRESEYDDNGNITSEVNYMWNRDSLTWNLFSKNIFDYQESGELISKINYHRNHIENKWDPKNKEDLEYDATGNIVKKQISLWDDSQNDWVNDHLEEWQYDVNGNMIFTAYSIWDLEIHDWVPVYKEEYSFDASSNQTLRSHYKWGSEENTWIGSEKFEYGFDENGKILYESKFTWNEESNNWIGNRKVIWVYDEYENLIHAEIYGWDNSEEDWLFIEEYPIFRYEYDSNGRVVSKEDLMYKGKSEYAYDDAGRNILQKDFIWDQTINDWRLRVMYEYGYNNEGRMILKGNLTWMYHGDLYNGDKREWQFNETGQITMESYYSWDNDAKEWVGHSKKEITYFQGQIKSRLFSKWDSEKNDWQNYLRETYYYSGEITLDAIEINSEENLRIYPNPADNYFRVQLPDQNAPAQLELYNLSGKKMLSANIYQGVPVDLSYFTSGIYTYRIIQHKNLFTGRIVKK